jgi:hypothetical protein
MRKPWIWLRIVSVFDGLFALGPGLGHVRTIEGGLPGETVVGAMKTFQFNAVVRTEPTGISLPATV